MNKEKIEKAVSIWKQGPKEITGIYHDWYNRLSVSFVKSFQKCGYAAILRNILKEDAIPKDLDVLTDTQKRFPKVPEWEAVGHYVEAGVFGVDEEKTFQKYRNNFFNLTKLKKIEPEEEFNAEYKAARSYIARVKKEEEIMKYIKHKDSDYHQIILFDINGVPFKCEIDTLNLAKGFELDFKTARDINEEVYSKANRKWESFIKTNDYATQRAVYQYAIYSKYQIKVIPFIAAVSKEKCPDTALFEFRNQELLEAKLKDVEDYLPYLISVLDGGQLPHQCKVCDFCKRDKIIKGVRVVPDSDY